MPDGLMNVTDVAVLLGATPRFVRRLCSERRIEYVKVGRLVRFERAAVLAYIERQRVAPLSRAEVRRRWTEAA